MTVTLSCGHFAFTGDIALLAEMAWLLWKAARRRSVGNEEV